MKIHLDNILKKSYFRRLPPDRHYTPFQSGHYPKEHA